MNPYAAAAITTGTDTTPLALHFIEDPAPNAGNRQRDIIGPDGAERPKGEVTREGGRRRAGGRRPLRGG